MTTLKTLSLSILAILAAVIFSMSQLSRDPNQYNTQLSIEEQKSPYSFDDPMTAYYLLDQLDIFEVLDKFTRSFHYETIYGTFRINDNYCSEHRAHFVLHPELVFNQKKIVSNYKPEHKIRTQVFPEIGAQDLYPQIYPKMDLKANNNSIDLTVDTNMFFFYNLFFQFRFIGLHYSCLSQASNHIPGNHKISRKDNVGDAMVSYSKQYQDRPQCFNNDKFFPKTWVMKDEEQCLDFFEEFNSPRYEEMKKERGIVYWRKIGVGTHKGMGVFPVNQEEEEKIRDLYQNGELCGEIEKNYLMQSNIHNLFLINGRKFHMRVYLLVASTNPVMAFYHDGYVRLSTIEYDSTSSEVKTFITNIDVHLGHGHGQEEKAAPQGNQRTEDEIQEETTWYWEDLHRYLMEQGLVSDPNWLNNYFRPELKKSMIHLVRMAQDAFAKKSSVYEVYGLDFIMDENLGLWFIEANNMPNMDGFTKESTILINGMLKSLFEIEYGLLKSRMKRVILYINQLSEQVKANNYQIPNLEQTREEFRRITMNRFEPEFLPSPENGFAPIIDENRVGTETYYNLIQEECL